MYIWSEQHEMFFNLDKVVTFRYNPQEKLWECEVEGLDYLIYLSPTEFRKHLLPRINRQ